jgi:GTP-binding protein EngB required for normal cell division
MAGKIVTCDMEIRRSSFLLSVPSVEQLPEHNMHEFAFIGRSNVGKSSLINMLCGITVWPILRLPPEKPN